MGGLNRPYQIETLPHVNVPVERPRVRDVIFSRRDTQDGLQVAGLPEDPSLWSESVSTQGPELRRERRDTRDSLVIRHAEQVSASCSPCCCSAGPTQTQPADCSALIQNEICSESSF